jgi:8-oxo-dGTP pyrophosphatase MutT (NUDIX family)
VPWAIEGARRPLGLLSPDRARLLAAALPPQYPLLERDFGWEWVSGSATAVQRSGVLQHIVEQWRDRGLIQGWRNELASCWGQCEEPWPYSGQPYFRIERAAFRYLGLRSHAVHIHGLTPDGEMWCGRRSRRKQTDPLRLDNLAAGGLPADEGLVGCAVREIAEEAGLEIHSDRLRMPFQSVVTERRVPEGWHSERLFVTAIALDAETRPVNCDGEVETFRRLSEEDVLRAIDLQDFTDDAACAIAAYFYGRSRGAA